VSLEGSGIARGGRRNGGQSITASVLVGGWITKQERSGRRKKFKSFQRADRDYLIWRSDLIEEGRSSKGTGRWIMQG